MKNLTWQNPEQLFVAQELINKVKSKCCGIKAIEKEHIDNNTAVRDMLLQRGIKPEQLSPNEDIKKVQRRINKDNKKNLKNK